MMSDQNFICLLKRAIPSLSARSEGSLSVERGAKFSKNERENKHRHQGGKFFLSGYTHR